MSDTKELIDGVFVKIRTLELDVRTIMLGNRQDVDRDILNEAAIALSAAKAALKAHQKIDFEGHDWEWAQAERLQLKKIRRKSWPKGVFVEQDIHYTQHHPGHSESRLYVENDDDKAANDWEIVR